MLYTLKTSKMERYQSICLDINNQGRSELKLTDILVFSRFGQIANLVKKSANKKKLKQLHNNGNLNPSSDDKRVRYSAGWCAYLLTYLLTTYIVMIH